MTKKTMLTALIASLTLIGTIATHVLAQYPTPPADYIETSLYSQAIYAKAQDWVRCSITNYFPDSSIYAQIYIYDEKGTVVWPTDIDKIYEVSSYNIAYERYQVQADAHYWCEIKVRKDADPKYLGWGRGDYSYEPAGLGYEPVHVRPYPAE